MSSWGNMSLNVWGQQQLRGIYWSLERENIRKNPRRSAVPWYGKTYRVNRTQALPTIPMGVTIYIVPVTQQRKRRLKRWESEKEMWVAGTSNHWVAGIALVSLKGNPPGKWHKSLGLFWKTLLSRCFFSVSSFGGILVRFVKGGPSTEWKQIEKERPPKMIWSNLIKLFYIVL